MADGGLGSNLDAAVVAVARASDAEVSRIYQRLLIIGRARKCSQELAEDLAQQTILNCLELGISEEAYIATSMRNNVASYFRVRKRRNLDYQWTFRDGDERGEPLELLAMTQPASQDLRLELAEVHRCLQHLTNQTRAVMLLKAEEYTDAEVAEALGMEISKAKALANFGRIKLRKMTGRKWGKKQKYFGVRKRGNRFECHIKVQGASLHIGTFENERDAALAYDKAVLKFVGRGRLNFPPQSAANSTS